MSNEGDGMEYDPELDGIEVGCVLRGEWLVIGKLGEGAFGEVWRVESKEFKHRAMKIVKTKESHNEIWALKKLVKSRYVPTIHAQWQFGNQTTLVMSLGIGDLKHYREANGSGEFKPRTSMIVTWHVLHALQYLHSQGVVHRDMKEDNICIKYRPSDRIAPILLIDYGHSEDISKAREVKEEDRTLRSSCYSSPHMTEGKQSTKGCDL
ncbi:hypothetical protein CAEBREN_20596 [Caenorhabditis brenneri]|uniref:Protein kinase domain-containing protein n=1 Tax=Caenorhabditis brenneri TaxID=135651 RepID=G0NIP5_CAEBE|nr:hypothetical protein CAEBREN_20596 [Caenorhabditis brenneri]